MNKTEYGFSVVTNGEQLRKEDRESDCRRYFADMAREWGSLSQPAVVTWDRGRMHVSAASTWLESIDLWG